jgi:hypothetical protein
MSRRGAVRKAPAAASLSGFDALGDDTLVLILQHLPLDSQLCCGALSRRWRGVLASAPQLFITLRFPAGVRGPDQEGMKRLCARAGGALREVDLRAPVATHVASAPPAGSDGHCDAIAAASAADEAVPYSTAAECPASALTPGRLELALEGSGCVALHTAPSPKKLAFSVNAAQKLQEGCPALHEGSIVLASGGGANAVDLPSLLPGVGKELQLRGFKPARNQRDLLAVVLGRYAAAPLACADLLSLDLHWSSCSQYTGATLATLLPHCTKLARLDLGLAWHARDNYAAAGAGFVPVMRALASLPALRELNVSYSPFGPGDAAALADSLETCETLTKVVADSTDLGVEGAAVFAAMLTRRGCTLTELGLAYAKLGPQGVATVAGALARNTSLRRLTLHNSAAGVEGAEALVAGLAGNATLQNVTAHHNGLLPPDVARFAAATGKRVAW